MRIALADPPRMGGWRLVNHPNMGILYLSSYLKKHFPGVEVLYLEQQLDLEEHLRQVEAFKPDLYGMSFSSMLLNEARTAIEAVARRHPAIHIVAGGPHPSAMPEEVLKIEGVEAVAIGEGEETLADLARALILREKDLSDVPGIAHLENGSVHRNGKRDLIRDLDTIPFPDWDIVDFGKYKGNYQYKASPSTAIVTNRGCAYNCNFCANPVWKENKPWVRLRSPENICAEIRLLYDRGIRDIYIRSDDSNVNSRWAIEVFRAIGQLGYKDLYFQCNLRGDRVSDEMARLFSEMGGWLVYLGIESGNDRTLEGIGKKMTLEKIERACRIIKAHDVDIFALFMIYHVWEKDGQLQWETYEDVNKGTLGFIRKLRRRKLIDYISFYNDLSHAGIETLQTALKFKLYDPSQNVTDLSDFKMKIPGVTLAQMKRSRLKGMLIQLWFVLASGNTMWSDFGRLKIKLKYLLKSI